MSSVTIYTLKSCDSCRKATGWLKSQNIPFTEVPIRENPPGKPAIKAALQATSNPGSVFNRSGLDYRQMDLKSKLGSMTQDEMIHLLHANGNLIKRPFVIAHGKCWTGFNEVEWSKRFALAGD